MMNITVIKIAW